MNRARSAGMVIRPEDERDWPAVHALETAGFASPAEAALLAVLRCFAVRPIVSLVEAFGAVA